MSNLSLVTILQTLPALIVGLTFHEFCHAYASYLLGDSTAKDMGRVSLNPLKHIDPLGFAFILLAGFGWAKPVEFDRRRLKKHSDAIKIAMAGPFANAFLAIVLSGIFALVMANVSRATGVQYRFFIEMLYYGILVNWGLFVFNMLPIPPLDGSHIFLSSYMDHPDYAKIYRYGTVALIVILILESQFQWKILPIRPAIEFLSDFFLSMFGYR
jgi:Zn-dependent protease